VDEAEVIVQAGDGGSGCLAFRREKFIPLGGPSGGDGGDGGSVIFVASDSLNTLVDFRYHRVCKAQRGEDGKGDDRTGKKGDDCIVRAPVGTRITDAETGELIGDLSKQGDTLLVAKGGWHGLGNARFKSSTNRAPRKITKGTPGDRRVLLLELSVIADVGLLGMPNAGKSSIIRKFSSARPKVADYPFTTLHPNLGVVRVDELHSFVMADIPGILEGAAQGVGLGNRFLKHLARTGLILHVIDIVTDPVDQIAATAETIAGELQKWDEALYNKPRWLVLNKVDSLAQQEVDLRETEIVRALDWRGPVFQTSAISGAGLNVLKFAIMDHLQTLSNQQEENETQAGA
ncbi:MAG TPA: Obg family GTPase CgtA, partial [Crenotrichaceae bacterium]|nr:Obg family GTPase CgtA [Crenotrichaceae bacterium]